MTALESRPEPIVLPRALLTPKEAGQRLGICGASVRKLIREGHLRAVKPPVGGIRIRPSDLEAYIDGLESL